MSIKEQLAPAGTIQRTEPAAHGAPGQSTFKTLLGIGAGNAVEWFDWAIYATFASFISGQLFSKADPTSAFLATMAIFAVICIGLNIQWGYTGLFNFGVAAFFMIGVVARQAVLVDDGAVRACGGAGGLTGALWSLRL